MSTLPQSEQIFTAEAQALAESADWQSVLTHFDFHEGFAFGLLLLPGSNLAKACRADLERHLALSGRLLLDLSPTSPEDLLTRCLSLARQPFRPEAGVIWISAVISEYQADFPEWNAAFQNAFARLNLLRNVLQQHLPCTLLFVGAPWIQSVIRSMAPDLWSVRFLVTTVANVALLAGSASPSSLSVSSESSENPDPEFALSEAAGLRGKTGRETDLIRLLQRAGQGFSALFRFEEAAKALTEALELSRALKLPPIELAHAEIALATSLIEPGHYAESMPHLEAALDLLRYHNITHDRARLDALAAVATLLGKAGRYKDANDLQERIVETAQKTFGPEDPRKTLTYMANLGSSLFELGDLARARSIQEQVLERGTRLLGAEHLDTLQAMNNLGATLRRLNDLKGARSLTEEVLEMRRRILGSDHVDTLTAMNNLATILGDSGDLAGALALEEQVLNGLSNTLGPEHPHTLTTRLNIAIYRARQGDLIGAREQIEQVLEARRRLFGPSHQETLEAMRANALLEQIRQAEMVPSQLKSPELPLEGKASNRIFDT